jgi:hypothetical protein
MKKIIIVLLSAFLALPGFSQIKFGLKVGAATSQVPTYNFTTGTTNIEAVKNSNWGFQGGAFVRINFLGIHVQPEVLFATTTFDYNVSQGTSPAVLESQTFNRLSIPVIVGLKIGPIRVGVGPAASIIIGTPKALIDDPNFTDMYKSAIWGYQAGVGIDLFKKLVLDARYAGSLGDMLGESVAIGGQTFTLDHSAPTFILSVGWMF